MKRRAIDKQTNHMVIINTWLFAVGSVLVFYHWYIGIAQKNQDIFSAIAQLTLNDSILLSTVAIMIGGLFYSIVILRPDFAKRQREKELLELTIEATHHDDYSDPATGFYNTVFFEKTLNSYLTEFSQTDQKLGLFFIDILDHEPVTDDLMKSVGTALHNTAREYDIVARISPKRFAVITPHIKTEDVISISKRFNMKLEEAQDIPADTKIAIGTASNEESIQTVDVIKAMANNNAVLSKRLKFES